MTSQKPANQPNSDNLEAIADEALTRAWRSLFDTGIYVLARLGLAATSAESDSIAEKLFAVTEDVRAQTALIPAIRDAGLVPPGTDTDAAARLWLDANIETITDLPPLLAEYARLHERRRHYLPTRN